MARPFNSAMPEKGAHYRCVCSAGVKGNPLLGGVLFTHAPKSSQAGGEIEAGRNRSDKTKRLFGGRSLARDDPVERLTCL